MIQRAKPCASQNDLFGKWVPMALYVEMLNEAYAGRREKNSQFSMNSFAKYLSMSPSQLNEVLQGKCGVSDKRAQSIAEKLQFSQLQSKIFCLSVTAEHARSQKVKSRAKRELTAIRKDVACQLQLETFSLISGWYHFAILELMNIDDFQPTATWISKRLNVDRSLISKAIARLKKLELIKVESGKWKRSEGLIQTTDDIPSIAIKRYHSQVLGLADKALYEVPVEKREFNSVFLVLDEESIPVAKKRIRKFQSKLIADLSREGSKKTRLMAFNAQMFPVG